MLTEIKGEQFTVQLRRRGPNNEHVFIQLLNEDEGHWHETDVSFSSAWLSDLIMVLQEAKSLLDRNYARDPNGYGYKF
jgi:hypothetical protein